MDWKNLKRIVVPVDLSEDSLDAVETALQIAGSSARLWIFHVLTELSPLEPGEVWKTVTDQSRAAHAEQTLRQRLSGPEYAEAHIELFFGDPGHVIAEQASKLQAELIVLPSHGRTGLAHLLIGSVAERVVRLAHCPVLVLRK